MALPFIVPFAIGFASGFLASRHGQAVRAAAKPLADRVGRGTMAALERGRSVYWAEREKLEDRLAEWREAAPAQPAARAEEAVEAACPTSPPQADDGAS